jgi:hypothetical protein
VVVTTNTMATINFKHSELSLKGPPSLRDQPEIEFAHRLKTGEHLKFIMDEKLFDVSDSRWSKAAVDGEVGYAHEYKDSVLVVHLKTADGKFNLTHNENGAFDRHLLDNPGETVVYSITSKNNGVVSTQTFTADQAGLGTIPMICAILVLTVNFANAATAANAALAAGTSVLEIFDTATVVNPCYGIGLVILGLIGIWIAYGVGREITLNLIYENRGKISIQLVDHYVYNIGDNPLSPAVTLPPFDNKSDPPWELYSDAVVSVDNYSKVKGIGVSLKFEKEDGTSLIICIRNDIYKQPNYTIQQYPKGDATTAQNAYDNCSGDLVTADFKWGKDLIVKNSLNPKAFQEYFFTGILSFHDAA